MLGIEMRLREERNRLKLIQMDAAKAAGVSFASYQNYERGTSAPNANALIGLRQIGFDILYILTGRHEPLDSHHLSVSDDDLLLLSQIKQLNERDKRIVLSVLKECTSGT